MEEEAQEGVLALADEPPRVAGAGAPQPVAKRGADGHCAEGEPESAPEAEDHAAERAGQAAGHGEEDIERKEAKEDCAEGAARRAGLGACQVGEPSFDGVAEEEEGDDDGQRHAEDEPDGLGNAAKMGNHRRMARRRWRV